MSLNFVLIQSKSIFALKAVNLYHLAEKSKNELIREIVFLEKLKNCDGVVKVNRTMVWYNNVKLRFRLILGR